MTALDVLVSASGMLRLERRPGGVAVVVFDAPGESVNTLRESFADEFSAFLDELAKDASVRGVVLASGKKDNFIAGADIGMLESVEVAEVGTGLSTLGQRAVEKIASFRVPVVAAIAGSCLGGGLEIALAAQGRVAADDGRTKLGLPEVQLGILPGMGGTQRLPRLVGLEAALDLLLTGKQIDGRRALRMKLVDDLVPAAIVVDVAARHALALAAKAESGERGGAGAFLRHLLDAGELRELAVAENPLGRMVVFDQAKRRLREKTQGNYPAPERILEVVRAGLERGTRAGLAEEARAFGELVVSAESRALRHVFSAQQAAKKDSGTQSAVTARRVERVGVLGSGLMGAGVAAVSVWQAGHFARLKDVKPSSLTAGLAMVEKILGARVERRQMSVREKAEIQNRLTVTTDYVGFANVDVVIEAVFEDLGLKQTMLADVEALGSNQTIFASNTSSLPIAKIAEKAKHPERVLGMHYFSPVDKMPLLEVIVTPKTADWVTATAVALGKAQGKTVIVVGDGPGFYTTRILGPYLNEAAFALLEGHAIENVDRALVLRGFPVGPLALLDEIGIDVGNKVSHTLEEAFGKRMRAPREFARLVELGRLGRKVKKGFYDYQETHKGKRPVDASVYDDLRVKPRITEPSTEVAERCLLLMVNEALHCLGEGILRSERDGDIGAIFGLGFPPFLGGPFHYARALGAANLLARLQAFEKKYGERFRPAPLLFERASATGKH